MTDIAFLDLNAPPYDADMLARGDFGGLEKATVNLAVALAARGARVSVINNVAESRSLGGVRWIARGGDAAGVAAALRTADVVVTNNEPRSFAWADRVEPLRGLPVMWLHNQAPLLKTLRRGRLPSLWRWRPLAVFPSLHQMRRTSRVHAFRGREVIWHGLEAPFLDADPPAARPPRAIYTARAEAGLAKLLTLWITRIAPACPEARLHVLCDPQRLAPMGRSAEALAAHGIRVLGRLPREAMIRELREARVMLYPGHPHLRETFSIASAEAMALGVPLVTLGVGALRERVRHGVDGFIARDHEAVARHAIDLLRDDALHARLGRNARDRYRTLTWDGQARQWEVLLKRNKV